MSIIFYYVTWICKIKNNISGLISDGDYQVYINISHYFPQSLSLMIVAVFKIKIKLLYVAQVLWPKMF